MSAIVGIDLSTKALDLVKLQEDSNAAKWVRCELEGSDAWGRTLDVRRTLGFPNPSSDFWEDVLLVAIEAPYGHGSDLLNRVVGAIASALPAHLRVPHRCWVVRPDEWKNGLGLKRKPTGGDVGRVAANAYVQDCALNGFFSEPAAQDARDAYCLAYWAREENHRALASASAPTEEAV